MTRRRFRGAGIALGGLVFASTPAMASDYSLPVDSLHYDQYVTAYFDVGGNQDWNCGSTTYSGHRGTDIGIGGFGPMGEGRPVVAAADGEVVSTHDGEPDMCTSGSCGGGGGYGNHVIVVHDDGKRTIYAHFKRYSVLVEPGQAVACGQPLGEVGSSGNSTGPHLHFEVRADAADDPFTGPCGGPVSWWLEQNAYQALPMLSCTDFVDPWPVLALGAEVAEVDGAAPEADSPRAPVGATIVQRFDVNNTSHPLADGSAPGLRVGFELDAPLRVADWWIETSCEEGLCPSPADDDPANPLPDAIDGAFALELGALAPGAHARVSLALVGETETGDTSAHTRFFVAHVDGVYSKASWDAAFVDESGRQTWNEGDLKLELAVGIDAGNENDSGGSAEGGTSDGDSASTSGSGPDSGDAGDTAGDDEALPGAYGEVDEGEGCSCRTGSGPWRPLPFVLVVFVLGLASAPRRRRRAEDTTRHGAPHA